MQTFCTAVRGRQEVEHRAVSDASEGVYVAAAVRMQHPCSIACLHTKKATFLQRCCSEVLATCFYYMFALCYSAMLSQGIGCIKFAIEAACCCNSAF